MAAKQNLARAVELDLAGDVQAALEAYLSVWPELRLAALGDRIDVLNAELLRRLPAVDVAAAGTFEKALSRRIASSTPLDVGPIIDAVEQRARVVGAEALALHLMKLADRHPEDPRVGAALLEAGRDLRIDPSPRGKTLLFDLVSKVLRYDDPRSWMTTADLARRYIHTKPRDAAGVTQNATLTQQSEALWARKQPKAPAWVTEALERASRRDTAPGEADLEKLLADVYADPSSTPKRLVYADALQEQGDPGGEFVMLQCTRAPDGPVTARERALLRNHGRSWLGDLEKFVDKKTVEFRRGFLAVAKVRAAHVLAEPDWATIEALDLSELWYPSHLEHVTPLLARDLEALTTLWLHCEAGSALEKKLPRVETLGLCGGSGPHALGARPGDLKKVLGWFPNVRRLEVMSPVVSGSLTSLKRLLPSLEVIATQRADEVSSLRGVVERVEVSERRGLELPRHRWLCAFEGPRLDRVSITNSGRSPRPEDLSTLLRGLGARSLARVDLESPLDTPAVKAVLRPFLKKR